MFLLSPALPVNCFSAQWMLPRQKDKEDFICQHQTSCWAQRPSEPGTTQGRRARSALGFNSTPSLSRMKKKNPFKRLKDGFLTQPAAAALLLDGDQLRSAPQYPPGHRFINFMGFLMKTRSGFSQAELAGFPQLPGPSFPARWKRKAGRGWSPDAPQAAPAGWKHPGLPVLPLPAAPALQILSSCEKPLPARAGGGLGARAW